MKYKITSKITENNSIIGYGLITEDGQYIKAKHEEVLRVISSGNIINAKVFDNRLLIDNYGARNEPYIAAFKLPENSDNSLKRDEKVIKYENDLFKFSIAHNKKIFETLIPDAYLEMIDNIKNNSVNFKKLEDRVYGIYKECNYILIEDLALYKFKLPRHLMDSCLTGMWNYYRNRIEHHMGRGYGAEDIIDLGILGRVERNKAYKDTRLIIRVYDGLFGSMVTEMPEDKSEYRILTVNDKWSRLPTVITTNTRA